MSLYRRGGTKLDRWRAPFVVVLLLLLFLFLFRTPLLVGVAESENAEMITADTAEFCRAAR
jgi:hypothetical protein